MDVHISEVVSNPGDMNVSEGQAWRDDLLMDCDGADTAGCEFADNASKASQFPAGTFYDQTYVAQGFKVASWMLARSPSPGSIHLQCRDAPLA